VQQQPQAGVQVGPARGYRQFLLSPIGPQPHGTRHTGNAHQAGVAAQFAVDFGGVAKSPLAQLLFVGHRTARLQQLAVLQVADDFPTAQQQHAVAVPDIQWQGRLEFDLIQ